MSPKPTGGNQLVYDEKLLEVAPEVTRGQRQEGYDADILNPTPPPASRTPAPAQSLSHPTDLESGGSGNDKHLVAGGYDPVGRPPKQPFWKTPKGLIIIAVVVIVIIAVAVGGGVGGAASRNKNNSNDTSNSPIQGSTTTTTGALGNAPTSGTHTSEGSTATGIGGGDTSGPRPTTTPTSILSGGATPGAPSSTSSASLQGDL
ncbi:hypothetical protein CTheo_2844 [Ceratobasidium theobromae]|uniref:Transmembrane protein n=1 Tax=Ceratobasidium theobromae TaxID=1582974 RepID=A0A5N5QPY5_9AGAM|nr:hypothetical protein CTheo_2844 [Ceratobasidium theobromae]